MEYLLFWITKMDLKNVYFLGTLKNSWGSGVWLKNRFSAVQWDECLDLVSKVLCDLTDL